MSIDYRQYQLNPDGSPATVVEPDTYLTPQQEKDKKNTGLNEFGNVLSTLGQLGMAGMALGAMGAFGRGGRSRGPRGFGKAKVSATGVPKSQFNPQGLSNKRMSVGSPTERVAQIGLTRSAATPYGPVKKFQPDAIQQFAKGLGQVGAAGKRAFQGVSKKVKGAIANARKDPFASTNVFEGKGPNETIGRSFRSTQKPAPIQTKGLKPNKKGPSFKTMSTIMEEGGSPTTPRSAYKTATSSTPRSAYKTPMTSTPKSAKPSATRGQQNLLRMPTAFTRAAYRA